MDGTIKHNHYLYRVYYRSEDGSDFIVYLGRTNQPLQTRLRGHFFKKAMHRALDVRLVSRIEYQTFQTEADMFFWEIYYINLYKPPLNCDDKARDELTFRLEERTWTPFVPHLMDKWIEQINEEERAKEKRDRKIAIMWERYHRLRDSGENEEARMLLRERLSGTFDPGLPEDFDETELFE